MAPTVLVLKERYQNRLAPGDCAEFDRLLLEADERLLSAGRWHWTREPVLLEVDDEGIVELPVQYESIVGCRLGSIPQGVVWQETEFMEGGPGELEVGGCNARLVDQGVTLVDSGELPANPLVDFDACPEFVHVRRYKLTDATIEDIAALCRFASKCRFTSDLDSPICPVPAALKQMMLSIIYEEANDTTKSVEYRQLALNTIQEHEKAYRGLANEIFKPLQFQPVRHRSRRNFP